MKQRYVVRDSKLSTGELERIFNIIEGARREAEHAANADPEVVGSDGVIMAQKYMAIASFYSTVTINKYFTFEEVPTNG